MSLIPGEPLSPAKSGNDFTRLNLLYQIRLHIRYLHGTKVSLGSISNIQIQGDKLRIAYRNSSYISSYPLDTIAEWLVTYSKFGHVPTEIFLGE